MKKITLTLACVSILFGLEMCTGRSNAKIPDAGKLMLSGGRSLNDELSDYAADSNKKPKLVYLFSEKDILSTSFYWEYLGPYLSSGTVYHTFDLASNREISLLDEIDPAKLSALKNKLKPVIREKLIEHRKKYSENEWIEAFGDKKTCDSSFNLSEVRDNLLGTYYLQNGVLTVVIDSYFAFPHVIQAMDFSFEWKLSFAEMGLYLKQRSVLNRLK